MGEVLTNLSSLALACFVDVACLVDVVDSNLDGLCLPLPASCPLRLFSSASLLLCLSSSLPLFSLYASLTYLFCPRIRVLFEARVVLPLRF